MIPIRRNLALLAIAAVSLLAPFAARAAAPESAAIPPNMPRLKAQPGFAIGWVGDASGKPLAGAKVKVWAMALNAFGRTLNGTVKTGPDGIYRAPITGNWVYTVEAEAPVDFDDKIFNLPCNPIKIPGAKDIQRSREGFVQNFVVALTGFKNTDAADPTRPTDYLGASIMLYYMVGEEGLLPPDSVVTVTLVPVGKLADGSAGKTLTFTRTVKALRTDALGGVKIQNTRSLHDIPLGVYKVSAAVTTGGATRPMTVSYRDDSYKTVSGETIDLHFSPQRYAPGAEIPLVTLKNSAR